jgi:hypothetical protein
MTLEEADREKPRASNVTAVRASRFLSASAPKYKLAQHFEKSFSTRSSVYEALVRLRAPTGGMGESKPCS